MATLTQTPAVASVTPHNTSASSVYHTQQASASSAPRNTTRRVTNAIASVIMCALLSTTLNSWAQTNAPWNRNGTSANSGDWLGTTNSQPFILKTNNAEALRLKPNGDMVIKSFDLNSTTLNGLVLTNGQGKIERYNFTGLATQYLAGNGTWQTLPASNTAWLTANNPADVYKPTGNVGIGTQPSPFFKLDVIGDARISNNLYVGGGVIITDKVQAATLIKGLDFKVDNDLEVQNSTVLRGATQLNGATTVNNTIGFNNVADFNNGARFNNVALFNGATSFSTSATFNGTIRATKGIGLTTANEGISYTPNSSGVGGVFNYGRNIASNIILPNPVACAAIPYNYQGHLFGGFVQIFDADPTTGAYQPNSGLLNMQSFTNGISSIDASTGGNTGGGLLINYFCGSNTGINTGINGGVVSMGKTVEIGLPYPNILSCALNIKGDVDYQGLNVKTNHTTDGTNAQFTVNRDGDRAIIATNNSVSGTDVIKFSVMGNGTTEIGTPFTYNTRSYAMLNLYANAGNNQLLSATDDQGVIKFRVFTDGLLETDRFHANTISSIGSPFSTTTQSYALLNLYAKTGNNQFLSATDELGKIKFRVFTNGKTQIGGKTSTTHYDAMLSVEGKVAAQSFFVTDVSDWADFVFDTNYKLPSLYEVEKYYTAHHHLPLIPSATEVKQNGIDLAQMNKLLLQKIEELTLQMVQLRKDVDATKVINK